MLLLHLSGSYLEVHFKGFIFSWTDSDFAQWERSYAQSICEKQWQLFNIQVADWGGDTSWGKQEPAPKHKRAIWRVRCLYEVLKSSDKVLGM